MIDIEHFTAIELRVGRVLAAAPNPKARNPALVLRLDFGALGERTSSAQICENHHADELVGTLVIAVFNLPPRRVAGTKSEVLVLAAVDPEVGTVLLRPDREVAPGTRIR